MFTGSFSLPDLIHQVIVFPQTLQFLSLIFFYNLLFYIFAAFFFFKFAGVFLSLSPFGLSGPPYSCAIGRGKAGVSLMVMLQCHLVEIVR